MRNPSGAPKRKMQDVSFNDVHEFLEYLPGEQRLIVEYLREIIFDCIPDVTEKLSYNVPFYKRHKNICFIWPSAVPWGGMKQEGVMLGFTNGDLMRDECSYLEKGGRKKVYVRIFRDLKDVDEGLLRAYIFEAAEVEARSGKASGKRPAFPA
jgi:hypothetical protein